MQSLSIRNLDKKSKTIILLLIDITIVISSYYFSILLHNKSSDIQMETFSILIISILLYIGFLKKFKMYNSIWINAGIYELIQSAVAIACATTLNIAIMAVIPNGIPLIINCAAGVFILILTTGSRMSLRIITRAITYSAVKKINGEYNVLIVGGGDCGAAIINDIRKEKSEKYNIVGIIDDNTEKRNNYLNGVKIIGNRQDIQRIVDDKKIDQILFTISKIDAEEKKKILDICSSTKAKVKVIPGYYELLDEGISINKMRDVDLRDLIGRDEVKLDKSGIEEYIKGKVILVTGGGGSIGSELCRQIAKFNPKQLLILDIYENNAYDLQNELSFKEPNLNKTVIIASVRDKYRLNQIMSKYRPDIIFHAAAHKHVPLMEDNPTEAIKNNVVGTLNLSKLASLYKVEKFVLISTDKAVNPTNIMGATKRLCEMIVQAVNNEKNNNTEFVAVRFGNVLGSNGSVIPLFKKQIQSGGPVTLTHKEITRYFMLIPEAAQLVLQAGAYAKGGEIFVLDMGSPVKIYDLAENLIRLSGFKPNREIEIKVTGLRPGEKLYEELLMNNDNLTKTAHNKIFIDRPQSIPLSDLVNKIDELVYISRLENKSMLVEKLKEVVPTYNLPEVYNSKKRMERVPIVVGGYNDGKNN